MKLIYSENGDYLVPDIALSGETQHSIGKGECEKAIYKNIAPAHIRA